MLEPAPKRRERPGRSRRFTIEFARAQRRDT